MLNFKVLIDVYILKPIWKCKGAENCDDKMASHGQENKKCCVIGLVNGIFIACTLLPLYCANNEDFFASISDVQKLFMLEQKLSGIFTIHT